MHPYNSEKTLPLSLFHALIDLDGVHEHVAEYCTAAEFGIRFEANRILSELADIERRVYALAGELRKAERVTAIPEV